MHAHAVWATPRSLAATDGITVVFFSSGYLDVSVPLVCLLAAYEFSSGYWTITSSGFPHSDIPGSKPAYGSPRRFGVRSVLLRHLAPRHPPCALCSLIYKRFYSVSSQQNCKMQTAFSCSYLAILFLIFAIQFSKSNQSPQKVKGSFAATPITFRGPRKGLC